MWKFLGSIQKEIEFPGVIQKKSCGISMGLGFGLVSEIPIGLTQLCGISNGEALFCLEFLRAK